MMTAYPADLSADIERRDAVIRAFVSGKDWDHSEEFNLVRKLLVAGDSPTSELVTAFPRVYDFEYELEDNATDKGVGDLLLCDAHGLFFCALEVKYIDEKSGSTARARRTEKRKHVKVQAKRYAKRLSEKLPLTLPRMKEVHAAYYTNETPAPVRLGRFVIQPQPAIPVWEPTDKEEPLSEEDGAGAAAADPHV